MVTLTDTGKALRDEAVHIPRRLSEAAGPILTLKKHVKCVCCLTNC